MPLAGRYAKETVSGTWAFSEQNLRELLDRQSGTSQLTQFRDLIVAVEYIHEKGVIHRDLKPQNVLVYWDNNQPNVRLSDFGHGRLIVRDTTRLTGSRHRIGTLLYMAPEQHTDPGDETIQCDIYALGLLLYEILTGRSPSPSIEWTGVPEEFREVVTKATRRNPSNRFESATEFRCAFEACRPLRSLRALKSPRRE